MLLANNGPTAMSMASLNPLSPSHVVPARRKQTHARAAAAHPARRRACFTGTSPALPPARNRVISRGEHWKRERRGGGRPPRSRILRATNPRARGTPGGSPQVGAGEAPRRAPGGTRGSPHGPGATMPPRGAGRGARRAGRMRVTPRAPRGPRSKSRAAATVARMPRQARGARGARGAPAARGGEGARNVGARARSAHGALRPQPAALYGAEFR